LTSGLALLMVIGLVIYAWRAYEKRHHVRFLAALSLFFMLTEALVGAGLVLFEYVALNKSVARAWWMGAHLLNTFILLACLTVTAWVATTGERLKLAGQGRLRLLCLLTILATLLVGVSGAISALGATLFPVTSVAEGLREDLSPTAHILVRLRIYHPIIAIVVSTLLVVTAVAVRLWRPGRWTLNFSRYLIALVTIQFALGLVNLLLHAPIPLQIIHLLLSDLIWMALILLIWSGMSTKWPERLVPAS
jgi:heme A synthase